MKIRLAKEEELDLVLNVLNKTTRNLRDKGIEQWTYPWPREAMERSINENHCYVLLINEKLVGTFCISSINQISKQILERESLYLSKMAVLPEWQGKNFGAYIIDFACRFARQSNKPLHLDCWAGNEKLKKFYSAQGLELIGDFPEKDYFISIFRQSSMEDWNNGFLIRRDGK